MHAGWLGRVERDSHGRIDGRDDKLSDFADRGLLTRTKVDRFSAEPVGRDGHLCDCPGRVTDVQHVAVAVPSPQTSSNAWPCFEARTVFRSSEAMTWDRCTSKLSPGPYRLVGISVTTSLPYAGSN